MWPSKKAVILYPDSPKSGQGRKRGPKARSGHRLVADQNFIYVFGGYNPIEAESELFRDLWRFHIPTEKWQELPQFGPIPVEAASYAFELIGDRLLLFGGTGFPFAEVGSTNLYVYDISTYTWKIENCTNSNIFPQPLYGHSWVRIEDYMYVFGGTTGHAYSSEIVKLDLKCLKWTRLTGNCAAAPAGRYRQEICSDGKFIYIFGGGQANTACPLNEVWRFELETNSWFRIITHPDPDHGYPCNRKCHSCISDDNYALILGGLCERSLADFFADLNPYDGSRKPLNDIWRFEFRTNSWQKLPVTLPKPLHFHASVKHPDGNSFYNFGGVFWRSDNAGSAVRTNLLFRVDINVKSLVEICWSYILKHKLITESNQSEFLSEGVPKHLVDRLHITEIPDSEITALSSIPELG